MQRDQDTKAWLRTHRDACDTMHGMLRLVHASLDSMLYDLESGGYPTAPPCCAHIVQQALTHPLVDMWHGPLRNAVTACVDEPTPLHGAQQYGTAWSLMRAAHNAYTMVKEQYEHTENLRCALAGELTACPRAQRDTTQSDVAAPDASVLPRGCSEPLS